MGIKQQPFESLKSSFSNSSRRNLIRRIYNRLQVGSALGLGVGFLLSFLIVTNIIGARSSRLADLFYQTPSASGQVVIVALDNRSIAQLGEQPLPRATIAQIVDKIAAAQPRVIALDLILTNPSPDDAALAQALRRAEHVVQPIVGVAVTRFPTLPNSFPRFSVALAPAPTLQTRNTILGHTLVSADDDGVVRRLPLVIESNGQHYPALGIAALEAYLNQSLAISADHATMSLNAQYLPVDDHGRLQLNFFNPDSRPLISAIDLLRNDFDVSAMRGKIVLVGVTGSAETDRFETPSSSLADASAIGLQADLIDTILTRHTLVPQDRLTQIVMVFLLALLAGATLPHVRILSAIGLTIVYFLLYVGYAFAEFNHGIVVQPIYPVLALGLMLIGTMVYRYFSEERHRGFLAGMMRRYLAPEHVAQATDKFELDSLPLRGVRREVSVLAIDLSELEPLASSLTAEAMIKLLNDYVALMIHVVFRHGGSLVKQTGSAILAAWNLIIDQPDHAQTAVRAAIDIRHELAEFNSQQPRELTIHAGMGIATGPAIAGRLGSSSLVEYTIIGEIVGMAERIALKPERGVFIDVTTRERLGNEFDMLEVKPVRLRRKTDPAQVWLLIEAAESQDEIIEAPAETPATAK